MGLELPVRQFGREADRVGRDRAGPACRARSNPLSSEYPRFELPLGETTHIVLESADVVHTFYIPAFNFGRYALPGVTNNFDFTPVTVGVFAGHCAQYCGLYHSEMLFSVAVVSPAAFQSWLNAKSASGAAA